MVNLNSRKQVETRRKHVSDRRNLLVRHFVGISFVGRFDKIMFLFLVLYIHVLEKKKKKNWTEFKIELRGSFKSHEKVSFSRGNSTLLVRNKYVQCKCPHLRPGKSYLLLGRFSKQMKFIYRKLLQKKI